MTHQEALALWTRLQDARNRHDVRGMMDCYAEDAVMVSPVFGEARGHAAIAASWNRLFSTLVDAEFDVSEVLTDGDRLVVLGKLRATDRLGWFGLPATGGTIDYRLALLLTVAGGKIIRDERFYDSTGVLERLEKARVDQELKTAAEVQQSLMLRTAQTGQFYESAGDSVACRAIGGDFFQFLELPSNQLGIAIGDVAGKGPAAALLAAMIQGMLAAVTASTSDPALVLSRIHVGLAARRLDWRFATLVYAVLEPSGRLTYSNAGHNPPALLTRNGIHRLTTGGSVLGVLDGVQFDQGTAQLRDRDTLVMFTDGVTEARDSRDEEFGEARLMKCLRTQHTAPAEHLLGGIFRAVREFCGGTDQSDDITVTVTRYHRPDRQSGARSAIV